MRERERERERESFWKTYCPKMAAKLAVKIRLIAINQSESLGRHKSATFRTESIT